MNEASPPDHAHDAESRFRRTLVRVLIVQVVALTLLGAIQALYNV
ncbi:MAG: hypothetical protein AAF389_01115 [Gemmatimonadota bacterium]